MKDILTICPSKNRPDRCYNMVKSFKETSSESNLIIGIDNDEKYKKDYLKITQDFNITILEFDHCTTTKIYNTIFNIFRNYKYYHMTNDDFIYKTKEWDKKFINKLDSYLYGICYGNDLIQKERLCTAPCISSSIIRAIGWLQLPTLTHLCGDFVWFSIGKKLNCLYYLSDVIIEHEHYQNNKANIDDVYLNTNSKEMYETDWRAFNEYVNKQRDQDIDKIRVALSYL